MATMVDAFGEAGHCDKCNLPTEEEDLQEWDNGDMVCRFCFGMLGELQAIFDGSAEAAESR